MSNLSKFDLADETISNVTFFWTKIQKPTLKFQSQTEKEFVVDVLVDKATAKAWNKEFPKQKAKEIDNDDFNEKFGAEHAIEGQDEQFIIRLKKGATYKDKETSAIKDIPEQYRPRVFLADENDELEDVTFTTLVGNGSKGVVQFEVNTNSFGTFAQLSAIKVENLVKVEGGDITAKFNKLGKVKGLAENPNANKQEQEIPYSDDDIPFGDTNVGDTSVGNTPSDDAW